MTKLAQLTAKMLWAAALAAPAVLASPAAAQVNGVAVLSLDGAVANSKAFTAAHAQIQTTYKAQIDQADTRSKAIQAELQPLAQQFETARRAPGANQAALQTQYQSIQAKKEAGEQELARITQPAQRAQAYAVEQIQSHLNDAVQSVVKARNVSLLVNPQAVMFMQPQADITSAVTAELDRLVPSVSTAVPANWQPGQQGQGAPATTAPARTPARNGGR